MYSGRTPVSPQFSSSANIDSRGGTFRVPRNIMEWLKRRHAGKQAPSQAPSPPGAPSPDAAAPSYFDAISTCRELLFSASVGKGGKNVAHDVSKLQSALNE